MRNGINVGFPSDRFKVEWWITSNRVVERMEGQRGALDLAHFIAAGARNVNPATLGRNNFPQPSASEVTLEGTVLLLEIPPDIDALRQHEPDLALAWRTHTRELFEKAFSKGYLVTDFVYLKGEKIPRSYYVLSHGAGTLG
jgi:predicted GNAT superfamily acetyltransferase